MINENTQGGPSTKIYFLDEQKMKTKKTVQPQPFRVPGTRFELARAKLTWT